MTLQPTRAGATALILCLMPGLLGASGDQWRRVAEKETKCALGLAELKVRFGPEFGKLVADSVQGCDPIPYKMAGLDDAQRQQVTLFAELLCAPWSDEWTKVFRACDRGNGPKWCQGDEEGEKHLQLHKYFDVMTEAMRTTSDQLARFNFMAIIALRLKDKVFRDFRESMVDEWVIPATSEFMKGATPDEVMVIAKTLGASGYGNSKGIASAFVAYATANPSFTDEQRETLNKWLARANVLR